MGARVFDPVTGTWTKVTTVDKTSEDTTKKESSTVSTSAKSDSEDSLVSTSSDSSSPKGTVEKKYNDINYNILNGNVSLLPTPNNLKINCGDTVKISNIGSYLSGKMYVQDREISIDSNGLSLKMTVIKTDFGDTLKVAKSSGNSSKSSKSVSSSGTSDDNSGSKTHVVSKGDTLWTIAIKYYGSGAKYTLIAEANNISKSDYTKLKIGAKLKIPSEG